MEQPGPGALPQPVVAASRAKLDRLVSVCCVCACVPLFSPSLSAICPNAAVPPASSVAITQPSMPNGGSLALAHVSLRENAWWKPFCACRRGPLQYPVWPAVSFGFCRALAGVISPPRAGPWTSRSQWPARASARHARPLECAPFPHARTRRLEWTEIYPRVHLHVPVRLHLFLACHYCFARNDTRGRNNA